MVCDFRRHSGHAGCPAGSGGYDGVATSSAPLWHCPRGLPSAAREQIHLEEGVSGCYGEVRRRGRSGDEVWINWNVTVKEEFNWLCNYIVCVCVYMCVYTATSVIISTPMRRRERRLPPPATVLSINQVGESRADWLNMWLLIFSKLINTLPSKLQRWHLPLVSVGVIF